MSPSGGAASSHLRGVALWALLLAAAPTYAQDAGLTTAAPTPEASPAARVEDAGAAADPVAATVAPDTDPRTPQIRALIAGQLDVAVDPQSLFDVPLADEPAIRIDAARIRALLATVEERLHPPPPPPPPPTPNARSRGRNPDASVAPDADADAIATEIATLDAAQWAARLELDRLRLEFYDRPRAARGALLKAHADRREAARPRETDEERRAREAEAEQQRALEAARAARTEAERVIGEELARLIAVERELATVRDRFADERTELTTRREALLGWQRRAREARSGLAADADSTYDALRRSLRGARDDLDRALTRIDDGASPVPVLGSNPLSELPTDVPTVEVEARRARLVQALRDARDEERTLAAARASTYLDEITTLNRERLSLLDALSPEKRDASTGFTAAGWDQGRAEARHLYLILRYHRRVVIDWLRTIRGGGPAGVSPWRTAAVLVPLAFLVIGLIWWRRRSPQFLVLAEERLAEWERAERRVGPSPPRKILRFLEATHRPIEWLAFFSIAVWILPDDAGNLLEFQILTSIVGWSLAASLVVHVVNALAASGHGALSADRDSIGALRLRSLRLVARVVVVFVLLLVLMSRLVGEGTISSWVTTTCWLAVVPVFLILVRWWRDVVFERVERIRKKSPLQTWVLANRSGWKSFLAAMVSAVQIFGLGTIKTVRNWLAGFNLARRAHAYLFKRELARLASGQHPSETRALRADAAAVLRPDAPLDDWVSCAADAQLARLIATLGSGGGGVIAVVGPRGAGKSSLLGRLAAREPSTIIVSCVEHPTLAAVRARTHATPTTPPRLVLLDDAHTLMKPTVGGLRTFDEVTTFARTRGADTLWVLAIDATLWPLLERARDTRPLFDDIVVLAPWSEEQIGALLFERCARAGITPTFEDLLEKLPPSADETDRQDALAARREGYVRMLWDHASGNPGVALEVWRASLVEDDSGAVRVRPLQVPDAIEIEDLPDSSLFILRAVLQLAPASAADVAEVTRLTDAQILNAFRFGATHGYLAEQDGRVQITWRWLRPVVRLLQRRHLLVGP